MNEKRAYFADSDLGCCDTALKLTRATIILEDAKYGRHIKEDGVFHPKLGCILAELRDLKDAILSTNCKVAPIQ